ncbi:ferritin family protein [Thermococcus sp.]|uniref:ferritin family protein n=1 Tax=Thermococcus sp. TaxID=35749 RepID=UPI00260E0F53|nr:ferritin family protein [Thermococcus sp.]
MGMKSVVRIEKKKAEVYRALIPLVPRDFKDDLKLIASHAERNAELLEGVKLPADTRGLKEINVALEFLEKALADPEATVEDYYRYAIDAEEATAKLYSELSMRAKSEKARRLFRWLAEISREHAEILRRHLEMWEFMQENVEEEEIPEDLIEQWFEDIDL